MSIWSGEVRTSVPATVRKLEMDGFHTREVDYGLVSLKIVVEREGAVFEIRGYRPSIQRRGEDAEGLPDQVAVFPGGNLRRAAQTPAPVLRPALRVPHQSLRERADTGLVRDEVVVPRLQLLQPAHICTRTPCAAHCSRSDGP